jgi:hypothetical protein
MIWGLKEKQKSKAKAKAKEQAEVEAEVNTQKIIECVPNFSVGHES